MFFFFVMYSINFYNIYISKNGLVFLSIRMNRVPCIHQSQQSTGLYDDCPCEGDDSDCHAIGTRYGAVVRCAQDE